MEFIQSLIMKSIEQVGVTLLHNWPYLILSVVIATLLKLYLNPEKISAFLLRYRSAGVAAATAAAVTTPLCSCGTTAIVLGMMASTLPWAPIVAFMVSSPLTSPEELVYSAGLFGWPFALTFFFASIALGLGGGWLTGILENRGWLANQSRFAGDAPAAACACSTTPAVPAGLRLEMAAACECAPSITLAPAAICACSAPQSAPGPVETLPTLRVTPAIFFRELFTNSKRLLTMFLGFAFIGYFLNGLIPASWVETLFGSGNVYSVPLAATLGLPFYINTESSLPLIRALMNGGMSQGAALAFMIAGSGTSIGAISGALTIARWRVVGLVVGILWVGSILSGFAFDLMLSMHLF